MDLLFAAKSPWNWDAERKFAELKAQHPEIVKAATSGKAMYDPETGMLNGKPKQVEGDGEKTG